MNKFSEAKILLPAAGIIPYIKLDGTVYFLLGLEKSNNKWSGFVGGYENKDGNILKTAIREFNEESGLIFSQMLDYIYEKISNSQPVLDITKTGRTVYLWFVQFPQNIFNQDVNLLFLDNMSKFNNSVYKEKSKLRWFSLNEIQKENVLYNLKKAINLNF